MIKTNRVSVLFIVAVLAVVLGLAPAALADDDDSLVGSWELVNDADPSNLGLATFNESGTMSLTLSDGSFSNAHGVWKESGDGEFSAETRSFIFASDGSLALRVSSSEEIDLSSDGQSYFSALAVVISLPDGTVVNSFSDAVTATRITVDDDSDSDSDSD